MYMISKGEVEVQILSDKKHGEPEYRSLLPGDYFGEISLVYQCKRTASVTSKKYSTLAKLTFASYKNLITDFP